MSPSTLWKRVVVVVAFAVIGSTLSAGGQAQAGYLDGSWSSNLGQVSLQQPFPDRVYGTLYYNTGGTAQIDGQLMGNVLQFRWWANPVAHGFGELLLSPDGAQLSGPFWTDGTPFPTGDFTLQRGAAPYPLMPTPLMPGPPVPVPGPSVPGPSVPGPSVPGPSVPGPSVDGKWTVSGPAVSQYLITGPVVLEQKATAGDKQMRVAGVMTIGGIGVAGVEGYIDPSGRVELDLKPILNGNPSTDTVLLTLQGTKLHLYLASGGNVLTGVARKAGKELTVKLWRQK